MGVSHRRALVRDLEINGGINWREAVVHDSRRSGSELMEWKKRQGGRGISDGQFGLDRRCFLCKRNAIR